jgi:hypothetical protein
LENILFSPRPRPDPHGDERERIARARQAAEAVFAPKSPLAGRAVSEEEAPTGPPVRKPRVLAVLPPAPVRREPVAPPVRHAPRIARGVPRSEHARIRAWVEYGMTAAEVAEVCGTTIGEIEHILRKS